MLNKPKFLSPSINMYGNSVVSVDVNSKGDIPFSCIVDGNEAIEGWQIVVRDLDTNSIQLDTGKQTLDVPFYPIDNRNQNVVFSINLKDYIKKDILSHPSDSSYSSGFYYYTYSATPEKFTPYKYNESTWENDYKSLYYTKLVNLKYDHAYYWTITFWGTTGTTVTSCEEVFYPNSKPKITLQYGFVELDEDGKERIEYTTCENVEEEFPLHYSKYYFKALYNQSGGVPLKRYGWRITDATTKTVVLDTITQNQIYGIADNILCIYDGFLSDSKYSVEVYVETQNNDSITIDPVVFKVMYSTSFLTSDFRVDTLREEPAIILDWSSSVVMGGDMVDKDDNEINPDDVMYKQNYPISNPGDDTSVSVVIPNNHSILYNYGATSNLDISENCYITLSTHLLESGDLTIFDAQGEDKDGNEIVRRLSYIEGEFIYSVLDSNSTLFSKKYTPQHKPSDYVWYTITMSPVLTSDNGDYVSLKVNESVAEGGLYPQAGLFPSTDKIRYPSYGTWNLKVEGGE